MENDYYFYQKNVDTCKFDIPQNINDIKVKDIDGGEKPLSDYLKGKKVTLIVNVASSCGYTDSNYKQLVELYQKYSEKGLEILGFPCNQFMGQEDKCELDIKNFSKNNYKVTFPMFSKIEVNGENTHPLYVYLKNHTKELNQNEGLKNIPWNFAKFLVDTDGNVVHFYPPHHNPSEIAADLDKLI
jgi:glutathione peroxidase